MSHRFLQSFKAIASIVIILALCLAMAAPALAWKSSWVRIDALSQGSQCEDVQVQLWPSETSSERHILHTYREEGVLLPVGQTFEVSVWGCGGYADKTIHVIDAWDQVKQLELR